jgi:DNA-directed RNA polymerase specialized sigma24 family protein
MTKKQQGPWYNKKIKSRVTREWASRRLQGLPTPDDLDLEQFVEWEARLGMEGLSPIAQSPFHTLTQRNEYLASHDPSDPPSEAIMERSRENIKRLEMIWHCIRFLPPPEATVLYLTASAGYTQAEAATLLNVSQPAVSQKLVKAIQALRAIHSISLKGMPLSPFVVACQTAYVGYVSILAHYDTRTIRGPYRHYTPDQIHEEASRAAIVTSTATCVWGVEHAAYLMGVPETAAWQIVHRITAPMMAERLTAAYKVPPYSIDYIKLTTGSKRRVQTRIKSALHEILADPNHPDRLAYIGIAEEQWAKDLGPEYRWDSESHLSMVEYLQTYIQTLPDLFRQQLGAHPCFTA